MEKIGKTLGFLSAEVINTNTGKVICYGRHTKYMNTPLDYVFREPIFSIVNFFLPCFVKKKSHDDHEQFVPSLDDIFSDKDISSLGMPSGRIVLGRWQTNGAGGLHVSMLFAIYFVSKYLLNVPYHVKRVGPKQY